MNKIYGMIFGKGTPSLQSVIKRVLDYEKKSNIVIFGAEWKK